jgi:competence protein ComEC
MILAWLCAGFIGGVGLGSVLSAPTEVTVTLALALALIAFAARHSRLWMPSVVLAAFCFGLARPQHANAPTPHDLAYYMGAQIQAAGAIDAEPDVRDTGANYEIAVSSVSVGGRSLRVAGALWVHTSRAVQLEYGDRVTVSGRLERPQYSPFSAAAAEVRFPRILDAGPANTGLLGWVVPLRQHLEAGINRWLPEPEAALLIAITLGARSASLGDLAPALISTGLIHLVAISGIKVALVAGTVHQLARQLGSRLSALLVSLAVLLGYVLLTGATVSGVRSATMWALVFVATYLGRNTVAVVSLGVAAAAMLALDPFLISNLGFLLTTVGTISIVVFTPPILGAIRKLPALLRPSPLPEALGTTLAAQIGTLPIVVFGFHLVSLSSPLANTLVLPLLPALILLGFVLGGLGGIAVVAAPVAALAYALLHYIVGLSEHLATLPMDLPAHAYSPAFRVLYYSLFAGVSALVLQKSNWAPQMPWHATRRDIVITLAVACAILSSSLAFARTDSRPTLYWLGSGDAMMVRSGGVTALIGGSAQPLVLLSRIGSVLPGSDRTIDLVIATDPRTSFLASYGDILSHYDVVRVLDVGAQYPTGTYARWRSLLRARGIPAYGLRASTIARLGSVRITAVAPDGLCGRPQECAGIVRVELGRQTVLIAGSADAHEQHDAIFRGVRLRSDVLVCPVSPCDPAFVSAVGPRMVFSTTRSAGPRPLQLPQNGATVISP